MVTITEGPELVTEHSWGCFYTCLGHEDRILGLEPSKCALCQDRLSKHQEAAMLLLILFLFWSPPPPSGNSYASFKTHLIWHLLCAAFPVLSQFLAFCIPNILDFC